MPLDEHRRVNLENWEDRVAVHVASRMYDVAGLARDPGALSGVVRRDLEWLPDLAGKDVVHLQCHIGTDTLSLARLGAATVTGYDFSPAALDAARQLAADAGMDNLSFAEGELYDAVEVLGRQRFDVVYTGTGALCWLPDIKGWAAVVAGLLRPGGVLHLHEGHPVLWALDEREDDLLVIRYPYFETAEPTAFDQPGTYTDGDVSGVTHNQTREWNHGLGEIVQAVIDAGLTLTMLHEHQFCDWLALPAVMEVTDADGAAVLREGRERLPLSYTLQARKPG